MTNEKAIEVLEYARNYDGMDYGAPSIALDMAISALRKQEHFREVTKKVEPLTLDDAIAHLDDTLSDTGRKWSCESCRMEHVQLRAWLAELRDIKQERNAPLTLDELREMPCEPVYIVAGYVSWWDIVSFAGLEYLYLKVEGSLPFIDYGKNWTAYRQKPEEGTD